MNFSSDLIKKTGQFKVRIRKEQLSKMFQHRRTLLLKQYDSNLYEQLVNKIKDSVSEQKAFLEKCSLALTGQPSSAWVPTIQMLHGSVIAFKGQFEDWFTTSVINALVLGIKDSQPETRLAALICAIFSDQVYLAWENGTDFSEKLMEFEILSYVVREGTNDKYDLRDRLYMLRFCSNISHYGSEYCRQFLRDGGAMWLILLGKEIVQNSYIDQKALYSYLSTTQPILSSNQTYFLQNCMNLNVVLQFIPLLAYILYMNLSDRCNAFALRMLKNIIQHDYKLIYRSVSQHEGLTKKIVQLITDPYLQTRFQAIKCVSSLLITQISSVHTDLIQKGIIDQMNLSLRLPQVKQSNIYNRLINNTLTNLTACSSKIATMVFDNPIMDFVIQQMKNQDLNNKKQAFGCLNNLIGVLNTPAYDRLIQDYQIMYLLALGLNDMRNFDADTTCEIINTLYVIVQKSKEIFNHNENYVVDQLCNRYNLISVLEDILKNTQHQLIVNNANSLHELISSIMWGSNPV